MSLSATCPKCLGKLDPVAVSGEFAFGQRYRGWELRCAHCTQTPPENDRRDESAALREARGAAERTKGAEERDE